MKNEAQTIKLVVRDRGFSFLQYTFLKNQKKEFKPCKDGIKNFLHQIGE